MQSMLPPARNHANSFPTYYGFQPNTPSPPSDYVLDLSTKNKKPSSSPHYTSGYPSPELSPVLRPSSVLPPYDPAKIAIVFASSRPNPCHIPFEQARKVFSPVASPRSPNSPDGVPSETASEGTSEASFRSSDIPECDCPKSNKGKITRPFKIVAKESTALSVDAIRQLNSTYSVSPLLIQEKALDPEETRRLMEESAKKYNEFKEKMLMQLRNNNSSSTNQNMRRLQNNSDRAQDPEYVEKRMKNNKAAKRSRDARRYKQDEIAIRATFLEQENLMLKYKLKSEVEDLERLRKM